MTTSTVDQLVADYLDRLDRAAGTLPYDQGRELVDEIGGHIASARAAGAAADAAAVRTMLDRLGTPEEIVAAARDAGLPPPVPARPPGTGLELAAVLMLTAGSFLPVLGWLVGVVLLWSSRRWTAGEKLLGTLVVPLGPGGVLVLGGLLGGRTCGGGTVVDANGTVTVLEETCTGFAFPPWIGIPLLVTSLVAPFVVAVWLYRRAQARAATEPPVPWRPGNDSPWGGLEIAAVVLLGAGAALGLFIPAVLSVIGLVLAWCSSRWSTAEKAVATLLVLLSVALLGVHYLVPLGEGRVSFAPLALTFTVLGPLAAAVFLAVRLSRRR